MTDTPEAFMAAPRKRKNHLRITAIAIAAAMLAGGGAVVGTTIAGQTVKSTVEQNIGEARSASVILGTTPMSFDVTPGYPSSNTFSVKNDGGVPLDYALSATSFTGFENENHPAYRDTIVTITDITEGEAGTAQQYGLNWHGTLAQFRDTAVGGPAGIEATLAPNETRQFRITMATPFDVNADEWAAAKVGGTWAGGSNANGDIGHLQGFTFAYTAIGTQVRPTDNGSAWRDAATWDGAMSAYELPNAALRAALNVSITGNNLSGPFVPGSTADSSSNQGIDPAAGAPAEAVTQRTFRDSAGRVLGVIWLDAAGNVVNGDVDGDGITYNADGTSR